jgi:hypothetical protein
MEEQSKKRKEGLSLLSKDEMQSLVGGMLWPFFNFEEILSKIYYGEDLELLFLIKKD